jgi:membrane protein
MTDSQWSRVLGWWALARELSRDAFRIFSERGARLFCGSIAFYALVSVVPILVIGLTVAGLILDPHEVGSRVGVELERWVGVSGARTLLALVSGAQKPAESPIASTVGAVVLIYASTRLFSQLMKALELLWETAPPAEATSLRARVVRKLEKRALAFAMVLGVGLMLVALVLCHMFLSWARQAIGMELTSASRPLEALVSFALTVALFSAMFRFLPSAPVATMDAIVGAVVTAFLFTLGSFLITAYVTRIDTSVYGAAGAIVMLMLWVHYSAHAFFLGAAFAAARTRRREALPRASVG